MALLVGEVMAKIGADRSEQKREFAASEADAKKLVKTIEANKPKLDADTSQVDTKLGKTAATAKDAGQQINSAFSSAWKSVVADLDKVEREAWQSGRAMDEAFTTSLRGVREQLDKVRADAGRTGQGLESDVGRALLSIQNDAHRMRSQVSGEFDKVADDAKEAGKEAGDSFGASLNDTMGAGVSGALETLGSRMVGGAAIGGFIAAGAAVMDMVFQGMEIAAAENKVGVMIAAQTGQASAAAADLGNTAGDLFYDHFGESIEQVGEAMTAVFQNDLIDTDASDADIEHMTQKVMTAGTVIGEEFNEISRAASQAVRTGLADNVTEALDMIVHASQTGLNVSGDLLDTVEEYGTAFREVGINGAEAFGLLGQAQKGGARDIDIAADAIKEFGILTQDVASNASRGFQAIGLDGERMGRMIAQGGEPARQALEQTLNALRAMPPGIERNSAAVDLFGTKAEDLGDSLFRMDLDTAADHFGNFAGVVEQAEEDLAKGTSGMEKFNRSTDQVKSGLGDLANVAMNGISLFDDNVTKMDLFNDALDEFNESGNTDKFDELREKFPELSAEIDNATKSTEHAADANIDYAGTFDDILEAQNELANQYLGLSDASIGAQEAIAGAHETAQEFANEGLNATKTGFDLSTEAGRANQEALNDVAKTTQEVVKAMREEGATAQEVTNYTNGQRNAFIGLAGKMGLSETAARQLANALFGIPKRVPVSVQVQIDRAKAQIAAFKQDLAEIPRSIAVGTTFYSERADAAAQRMARSNQATGAVLEYFAGGGMRPMSASSAAIVQPHTRTGVMRVIADNPVADEAFIPLQPNNPRSQSILDETLKRMRPNLAEFAGAAGMADGGMYGGTAAGKYGGAVSVREGHSIVINGPDPNTVVRKVLDAMDAREALYGA